MIVLGGGNLEYRERRKNEYEFDMIECAKALMKSWYWILLTIAVCVGAMFVYTRYVVAPKYQSSVSFYVNNGQRSEDKISTSDISASQRLVDTYMVILKFGTTLDAVIEDAQLDCTVNELSGSIKCSAINDTEVFQVTVTDESPQRAARIAQSIERILPDKVSDVIEGSTVRVVRNPSVPTSPSSPNLVKNLALGAAVGLVLSCLYLALRYIFDDRIMDAAKLLKTTYPYPVLAVIPELTAESKGYYYSSYKRKT